MRCRAWLGVHLFMAGFQGRLALCRCPGLCRVVQVVVTERIVGNARAIHRIGYGGV